MEPTVRTITDSERDAFDLAVSYGFGDRWEPEEANAWVRHEPDRRYVGTDAGDIVATGRNYALELTVPGGAVVPAGGVSAITTRPTHRRRGFLRAMMRALILDSAERGEAISMLTASEGGIYGRFGYGIATRMASLMVPRQLTAVADPPAGTRVRMVEPAVGIEIARALFARGRGRVGIVSRPDEWWSGEWAPTDWIAPRRRFDVVVEVDGEPAAYALYAVTGAWRGGHTEKVVEVRDFIASTPDAEHALWHYLLNIDQTVAMRAWNVPFDSPLPWLLGDPRQCRTEGIRDFLWLRPIVTEQLLATRTSAHAGEITIQVDDPFLGLAATEGRFRMTSDGEQTTCTRTDQDPDLIMDASALGAIALGGVRPSVLARAGRIEVAAVASVAIADGLFRAEQTPFASTWF